MTTTKPRPKAKTRTWRGYIIKREPDGWWLYFKGAHGALIPEDCAPTLRALKAANR